MNDKFCTIVNGCDIPRSFTARLHPFDYDEDGHRRWFRLDWDGHITFDFVHEPALVMMLKQADIPASCYRPATDDDLHEVVPLKDPTLGENVYRWIDDFDKAPR